MSECQTCSSPTGDGANLCRTHTAALTHLLGMIPDRVETLEREHLDAAGRPTFRDLRDRTGKPIPYRPGRDPITHDKLNPGLASDLEITVTRQDKLAPATGPKSSSDKPLDWNERASGVSVDLSSTVNAWALETSKHAEDTRDPLSGIPHTDLPGVAEWLIRNVHTLRVLPNAGEAYSELTDAIRRAEAAIDRPAFSSRFHVGPCPETDAEEVPCPGEVWAFIPISEEKPAMMVCQNDECGAAWNTTQWLRTGGRILRRAEQLRRDGAA